MAGRGLRGRAARRARAAIGHALAFPTWRSLAREQGLDDGGRQPDVRARGRRVDATRTLKVKRDGRDVLAVDALLLAAAPREREGGVGAVVAQRLEVSAVLAQDRCGARPVGVPPPQPPAMARAILHEDRAYLEALRDHGADAPLPLARRSGEQKRIHGENVAAVAA